MNVPQDGLLLAGFVLAHALWSVSDLPKEELLVPLAITETKDGRNLHRFEAETQEDAIAKGKAYVKSLGPDVVAWAFAREGLIANKTGKVDVISVDVWAKGMDKPITLIQRFEPYSRRRHFQVIGKPDVLINSVAQDPKTMEGILDTIEKGILQHSKVQPLWAEWQKP